MTSELRERERRAPVQGYSAGIPWSMHLRAYDAYCKKWSPQPALIDLEGRNCRGGFSVSELDEFIPGWREELSELTALRTALEAAERERDALVQQVEQQDAQLEAHKADWVKHGGIEIALSQWKARAETAEAERDALRTKVAEYDELFDLQWQANIRAINRWRAENPGNDLVMPDSVELSVWLMRELSEALEALRPFAEYAPFVTMFVEGRATFGGSPVLPTKHFRKADFERAAAIRARATVKP